MKSNPELIELFAAILQSENAVSEIKTKLDAIVFEAKQKIAEHEAVQKAKWAEIEAHIQETGEYEIILPGSATNYKIDFTTPRESVKVDADAAPDEWVKLERSPMLKEIGKHLKALRDAGQPFPNWARLELGEKRLQWRAVKK